MSCLSVINDRGIMIASVVANPISPTSPVGALPNGSRVTFEVFADDADALKVGDAGYYTIDGEKPFWGTVKSLEPCVSTHPGLALLREKPTLRCVLEVFSEEGSAH